MRNENMNEPLNSQSCKTRVMPCFYVLLFSSGRTSGMLAKYFLDKNKFTETVSVYGSKGKPKYKYHLNENGDRCVVLMMNTGRECKESLQFANKCDNEFKLNTIYLEAVVNKGRISTSHKIVKYAQLDKKGLPFEQMLSKYPLPNNMASNCTRELKQRPKESFLKSIGWKDVITVVGIRKDEEHRKSINAKIEKVIYPLCDELPMNQRMVREFWDKQTFDLQLKDYQGNCDLCFKKSLKKRLTIIKENPSVANWWLKMEEKHAFEDVPRFDLRTNKSIAELIEMAKQPFTKAEDLHELSKQQQELFEFETDCFCKSS
jgi:hypothetical protein